MLASFVYAVASFRTSLTCLPGAALRLPRHLLKPFRIDAAHIVADKDERFGQPAAPNGIPVSKIHHAAFDAHLIGIDADYRLHVSERLIADLFQLC